MLIYTCEAQSPLQVSLMGKVSEVTQAFDTAYYYVLWGQSNMTGRDELADLPVQYAYLDDTIHGATISYDGSTLLTLIAGLQEPDQTDGDLGPDLSLSDTLVDINGEAFILKYSIGGTSLAQVAGNDWNVNSTSELFANLLTRISAFEFALQQINRYPKLVAVIGMQGESDGLNEAQSLAYQDNMEDFIDAIRSNYPGVPMFFGSTSYGTYGSNVLAAQTAICRYELSGGSISDTGYTKDDTYLISTSAYTKFDGLHFDAASTVLFGYDIYKILEQL